MIKYYFYMYYFARSLILFTREKIDFFARLLGVNVE